ncbi:MAG TPA: trypsin-like peptidase domain-containing protein [Kofleriaceae bacterium]
MGLVVRIACALLIATATASAEPPPQQKIALTAKPSVVRVWGAWVATYEIAGQTIPNCCAVGGSGTGFFITSDGYIATNAHVVSDIHDGEKIARAKLYDQLMVEVNRAVARELGNLNASQRRQLLDAIKLIDFTKRAYVVLPNGEKLEYEIKEYGKPGSGRDAAILKVKIDNAPALPIGDSTRTQVADQIVVIGYPGVADMKVLLDEKSQLQATVTDGTVSSLKRATSGEQILQISAPITHGNSGGPALDMKGNVIGLATFGNESEIQGFNFLVASATLRELVKDAKLDPKPSKTLQQWRSGLDHFWADEYTAAIENFREVESLFPLHSEAGALIRQSNEAKKEGKEKKPEGGNGGLIAGLVIGGLVVVGGGGLMLARRKKSPAPQHPPQHAAQHPHHAPHMQPAHAQPPHAPPQYPPQQHYPPPPGHPPQQQMYGRVQPQPQHSPHGPPMMPVPAAPVAKTVAIAQPNQSGGIAPTAFGSLSIGSLWCTRGSLQGQRFALTATGIIIGRQPGVAHVLVNDHRASGKHVWIGIDQGKLVAIDQGTTNGTYINDVTRGRITRHELRDGDVVIVSEPDCLSLQIRLG